MRFTTLLFVLLEHLSPASVIALRALRKKLLFPLFMVVMSMTASAVDVNVTLFSELQTQIGNYASENADMTIIVKDNITMTGTITIPANAAGHTLTIKSDATRRTITRGTGITGNLFTVKAGSKLIMENIIIDGNKSVVTDAGGPLVYVSASDPDKSLASAEFRMNDGAILQNNTSSSRCGGVYVSGTFVMSGVNSKICGNEAQDGAGIFVTGTAITGTATMESGEISNNKTTKGGGGGVCINIGGAFTMRGGKITGNEAPLSDSGGGVLAFYGTFTMTGGEISNNKAGKGGGVHVRNNPPVQFTLGGSATITGNTKTDGTTTNNVELEDSKYITLGTGDNAPTDGMNVGVTKTANNGVFVNSGATAAHKPYFFADNSDKVVGYQAEGKLALVDFLGSGTEDAPYEISNAADLARLAKLVNGGNNYAGKYFIMTANIDLTDWLSPTGAGYDNGGGWIPIGTQFNLFQGTFDGQGDSITGLWINREGAHLGLFGVTGWNATLQHLTVTIDLNKGGVQCLTSEEYAYGGLVGFNMMGSTILHCGVTPVAGTTGTMVSGSAAVGGLAGANAGSISESYATGDVTGKGGYELHGVGGLVGGNAGTITNSYATGAVTGTGTINSGGLAGRNAGAGTPTISNCYATGTVTGSAGSTGGLVGRNKGDGRSNKTGTVTTSFFLQGSATQGIGDDDTQDAIALSTEAMRTKATFTTELGLNAWDFDGIWAIASGINNGYPYLQWQKSADNSDNPDNPDPRPSAFTVTLIADPGINLQPSAGTHGATIGGSFTFYVTLAPGFEGQTPQATVNGDPVTLTLRPNGTEWMYVIPQVYDDTRVVVSFATTGNEAIDAPHLYSRDGQLFIETTQPATLTVYSLSGQTLVSRRLSEGLTVLPLPRGVYVVKLGEQVQRVVVK